MRKIFVLFLALFLNLSSAIPVQANESAQAHMSTPDNRGITIENGFAHLVAIYASDIFYPHFLQDPREVASFYNFQVAYLKCVRGSLLLDPRCEARITKDGELIHTRKSDLFNDGSTIEEFISSLRRGGLKFRTQFVVRNVNCFQERDAKGDYISAKCIIGSVDFAN